MNQQPKQINSEIKKRLDNLLNLKNKAGIDRLIEFLQIRQKANVNQMLDELNISRQALYKHYLNPLIEAKIIEKFGNPPKVYYSINTAGIVSFSKSVTQDSILDDYIQITPSGKLLQGVEAFQYWCAQRGYNYDAYLEKYKNLQKNNLKFRNKSGLISANNKMQETFNDYALADTLYVDFYANEIFGKTSLGQLVLYAKQSQDKKLFRQILNLIDDKVNNFIKLNKFEAVCFVPPTVKRGVQIMSYLDQHLAVGISRIKLSKITGDVITPQKTLSKLKDRITNINQTVLVDDPLRVYNRILIIDDAVGSGASFNEVAKMLKNLNSATKIYGLAIVGSKKGFDVINEV